MSVPLRRLVRAASPPVPAARRRGAVAAAPSRLGRPDGARAKARMRQSRTRHRRAPRSGRAAPLLRGWFEAGAELRRGAPAAARRAQRKAPRKIAPNRRHAATARDARERRRYRARGRARAQAWHRTARRNRGRPKARPRLSSRGAPETQARNRPLRSHDWHRSLRPSSGRRARCPHQLGTISLNLP